MSKGHRDSVRAILAACQAQGCTVELRRGGHYKVTTPSGACVFVAASPSDRRAPMNTARDLRRCGVRVPA